MMLTKTNVLTFCLLFLTQIHFLRAEDGYDLWLRYVPVADAARFAEYRAQIEGITIFGNSDNLNRHVERGYAGAHRRTRQVNFHQRLISVGQNDGTRRNSRDGRPLY